MSANLSHQSYQKIRNQKKKKKRKKQGETITKKSKKKKKQNKTLVNAIVLFEEVVVQILFVTPAAFDALPGEIRCSRARKNRHKQTRRKLSQCAW